MSIIFLSRVLFCEIDIWLWDCWTNNHDCVGRQHLWAMSSPPLRGEEEGCERSLFPIPGYTFYLRHARDHLWPSLPWLRKRERSGRRCHCLKAQRKSWLCRRVCFANWKYFRQTLNEQKIFPDESRATTGKTEYAFISLLFLCFLWQSSVAQFHIDWRKVCKTFWQNKSRGQLDRIWKTIEILVKTFMTDLCLVEGTYRQ